MAHGVAGPPPWTGRVVISSPADARILVATDNVDDARQIQGQLADIFKDVRTSTSAATSVEDFETCRPDVLVLAFDALARSERYYLGLYRHSSVASQGNHRTVVLCGREDVAAAFDLCRKDYFDDYVLFWPLSYDGSRLAMSIWAACRRSSGPDERPGTAALLLHGRHLAEVERVVAEPDTVPPGNLRERLEPALADTRQLAEAVRSLKANVLVVEDDEFAQRLVRQSLNPARWAVAFASDSQTALAYLRRRRPDVILMDVGLPGQNGVALTRQIKAMPALAGIPILMMTGDSRRETLLESLEAGAAGFVVKPVTAAALNAKLDKLVPR